jgi:hypothetical protein
LSFLGAEGVGEGRRGETEKTNRRKKEERQNVNPEKAQARCCMQHF